MRKYLHAHSCTAYTWSAGLCFSQPRAAFPDRWEDRKTLFPSLSCCVGRTGSPSWTCAVAEISFLTQANMVPSKPGKHQWACGWVQHWGHSPKKSAGTITKLQPDGRKKRTEERLRQTWLLKPI